MAGLVPHLLIFVKNRVTSASVGFGITLFSGLGTASFCADELELCSFMAVSCFCFIVFDEVKSKSLIGLYGTSTKLAGKSQ